MAKPILTQEYLKECLHYDPETGIFIWKRRPISHYRTLKSYRLCASRFFGRMAGCPSKSTGYIEIQLDNQLYRAHRLAFLYMNGEMPEMVDHINHDGGDNRWGNLRSANYHINHRNKTLDSRNTSGHTGVCYEKKYRRWIASIGIGHKNIHIGKYETMQEAVLARKEAEIEYGYHPNHGKQL